MDATLDDYVWLTSSQAASWLARTDLPPDDTLTCLRRLREELPAARASLIVETWQLRRRAQEKFRESERLFFSRRALQQATDESLALYKASRFPASQQVWDLCCGMGGDLLGLARRGPVIAVDRDPILLMLAKANVRVWGGESARFEVADVQSLGLGPDDFVHIDPDRRPEGGRVAARVIDYEPGVDFLAHLLEDTAAVAIKLAPAARIPDEWEEQAEREWISTRGECRQQVLWSGKLATDGPVRRATRLGSDGRVEGQYAGKAEPTDRVPPATCVGEYLFDPDPSLLAAGLVDSFAAQWGLRRMHAKTGYLTGNSRLEHPLVSRFRVLQQLPLDRRRVKRVVEALGIGRLEVKKRGVDIDPARLSKMCGGEASGRPATLILTPAAKGVSAILTEREGK